jgi:hypothetical protein
MSDRVLLTDAAAPIYHNPNPTDSESIEFKHRWKGYCLFEFYETGQLRFWEGGEPKKELGRYVVVWDGEKPITFMDGMWCESEGWKGEDAVLAPGTTEDVREAFRAWVKENPDNRFGIDTMNIDRKVTIEPVRGTLEDAKRDMATLFDSYLQEQLVQES